MPFFTLIVFYAFSALLLGAALGVVLARNTVHSALLLVLAFVASAGLWMLLYAEFLAIVLVLVYVGAVMVLFLFVLMMLDTGEGAFAAVNPLSPRESTADIGVGLLESGSDMQRKLRRFSHRPDKQ